MGKNSQPVAASEWDPDTGAQDPTSHETRAGVSDHPVDVLIAYMAARTDAEYVVVSSRDLYAIFGTDGLPEDIMAGLEAIQPPITVDENGIATLAISTTSGLDEPASAQSADRPAEELVELRGDDTGHEQAQAEDMQCA